MSSWTQTPTSCNIISRRTHGKIKKTKTYTKDKQTTWFQSNIPPPPPPYITRGWAGEGQGVYIIYIDKRPKLLMLILLERWWGRSASCRCGGCGAGMPWKRSRAPPRSTPTSAETCRHNHRYQSVTSIKNTSWHHCFNIWGIGGWGTAPGAHKHR